MNPVAESTGVTDILREGHRKIQELFREFERAEDKETRKRLAEAAFTELTIHGTAEEELFYPAIRDRIGTPELVDDAVGEHQVAKELITELENMEPDEALFNARFGVLAENVRKHILEEEALLFTKIEESDEIDLRRLGEEVAGRQASLREELEDLTERARMDGLVRQPRHERRKKVTGGNRRKNSD